MTLTPSCKLPGKSGASPKARRGVGGS
uniref:Uncharacterized protein MANES_02G075000 n=1 Tax=Rhizophora mucronata TaxID=61149 RepID=A0A2P2LVB6_RHIMU